MSGPTIYLPFFVREHPCRSCGHARLWHGSGARCDGTVLMRHNETGELAAEVCTCPVFVE